MADDKAPHGATTSTETATETDWKAEARKWEQRAKENLAAAKANEEAAKRLAGLEQAKKSAEEQWHERITALEAELGSTRQEAMKARIQAKYKVSDEDAELFLTAGDAEGLEKQAKALADRAATRQAKGPVVPSQKGGEDKGANPDPLRELASQVFKHNSE